MTSFEEPHPQYEHFVCIYLTDADEKRCNSVYESNISSGNCQLSTASDVEKAGVQKPCSNTFYSDSSTDLDWDNSEKDCRICSINLETEFYELGDPIVLGCSCNGDLASAHRKCAEKWFQIKGNMNCEICGATVKNLVVPEDSNSTDNNAATNVEGQRFFHGHRLISGILGGMLLAIGLCWLLGFHRR